MRTRINYPKISNAIFASKTTIPNRTVIINNKRGKDIIENEFIGLYARRDNPIVFLENLVTDIENLIQKLIKRK